jgi:hypothetical protein
MTFKNFGDNDFTLKQAREVMERHGIPVNSAFHGVDSFDVADALLTMETEQQHLYQVLSECVNGGYLDKYPEQKLRVCGALAKAVQP